MDKTVKAKLASIVIMIVLAIAVTLLIQMLLPGPGCCMCGDPNNDCCPCPNPELITEVENFTGRQASSAGSWYTMCNEYKDATGDTRECFE